MARGGINKALVQIARRAIQAKGENPSIDAVRVELGNTGSKTTIHRYLKEIEESERGSIPPTPLSERLGELIGLVADRLKEEAAASVAEAREQLTRERLDYEKKAEEDGNRIQQLEDHCAGLAEQLRVNEQTLHDELKLRQRTEVENARLTQAQHDQASRIQDRDDQIRSLEDKHQHARDALEHYRQASKDQREQEQRRHESQVQQLHVELRQLQQTLARKQDDVTQLNRDNARLLAEASQFQKDLRTQQKLLDQRTNALELAQITLSASDRTKTVLEQRCNVLQEEVARSKELSLAEAIKMQSLQERLIEVTMLLKSLKQEGPPTGNG